MNLKDKHTQGKFVRETSAKDIKKCSCFPLIVKGILLIKTIVATDNVQRPARRRRTVLCMYNRDNTYSLDAILSPRNVHLFHFGFVCGYRASLKRDQGIKALALARLLVKR